MSKKILCTLLAFTLLTIAYSQKTERDVEVDTISKTKIESLLHQTSITKKVEFVEVNHVNVLSFEIIIVTSLKTGSKVKGLYLSNQGGSFWTSSKQGSHHAYLDEAEIDDLISFFENCDATWKNEKPVNQVQYIFETLDNLQVTFWSPGNSKSWEYEVKFSSYLLNNTEKLGKSQSDDLLAALKQVKTELKKY